MAVPALTLTPRARRFVDQYVLDLDIPRASQRAGVSHAYGYRLAQRADVDAWVREKRRDRARRLDVTLDRIIEEYARVAFGSIQDVSAPEDGSVRRPHDMTQGEAAIIAGYEETERTYADDDGSPVVVRTVKVKLHDKLRALDVLKRYVETETGTDQDSTATLLARLLALPTTDLATLIASARRLLGPAIDLSPDDSTT